MFFSEKASCPVLYFLSLQFVAFKRLINTAVNNRVLGEPKYKHSKDKYMKHPWRLEAKSSAPYNIFVS